MRRSGARSVVIRLCGRPRGCRSNSAIQRTTDWREGQMPKNGREEGCMFDWTEIHAVGWMSERAKSEINFMPYLSADGSIFAHVSLPTEMESSGERLGTKAVERNIALPCVVPFSSARDKKIGRSSFCGRGHQSKRSSTKRGMPRPPSLLPPHQKRLCSRAAERDALQQGAPRLNLHQRVLAYD